MPYRRWRSGVTRRQLIVGGTAVSGVCLGSLLEAAGPSVQFTRIPKADVSGSDKNDIVAGTVTGFREGQRIVLYAKNRSWWLQPLLDAPFTRIAVSGKWFNGTHLGSDYAALLVDQGYRPERNLENLPAVGGLVAAVAVTRGAAVSPSPTLQFSGYEWRVRDKISNRGGRDNPYSADNAWTDAGGALHLRIKKRAGRFECAEVALTRSLGYGTYSFSVRDLSNLPRLITLEMYTWDYSGTDQNNREIDVTIKRLSTARMNNARFFLQPYQVSSNLHEFDLPPGAYVHSFRWKRGQIEFVTATTGTRKRTIAQHDFTLGVPNPGLESARITLYLPNNASSQPAEAEVVVDRFEYTP